MNGLNEVASLLNGEDASPSGWRATKRTTASSLQIGILDSSSKVDVENLPSAFFVADADHGKAPHDLKGLPDVKVEWLAEDRLRVARHPQVRVFRTEVRKDRVAIQYELDSSILNHAPAEAAQ